MAHIFNIRGTNGSGKSTLAWQWLHGAFHSVVVAGVECARGAHGDKSVCVVRPYQTNADNPTVANAVYEASYVYDITIFESAAISVDFDFWALFNQRRPFWWCYLDTPIEICLIRCCDRRLTIGDVYDRHLQVHMTHTQALAADFEVRTLNHKRSYDQLATLAKLD